MFCTDVKCDESTWNADSVASNGCEANCAEIDGGLCLACNDNDGSCTKLECDEFRDNLDQDTSNGCERKISSGTDLTDSNNAIWSWKPVYLKFADLDFKDVSIDSKEDFHTQLDEDLLQALPPASEVEYFVHNDSGRVIVELRLESSSSRQ